MSTINKWIWVTTGGVSGLLLGGAGAMYAPEAITNIKAKSDEDNHIPSIEENEVAQQETELQVAEVGDDMTFSEAFAEAREEVGAGGVFYWQGGIYSTFYKEEWDNMTAEEKQEFGELANEMFPVPDDPKDAVRPQLVENETTSPIETKSDVDEDATKQDVGEKNATKEEDEKEVLDEQVAVGERAQQSVDSTDAEPQIVDYGTVDGHLAMTVDQNGDGVADYILVDADDSNDISTDDLIVDRDGNVSNVHGEYIGNLNDGSESNVANDNTNNKTDNGDDELAIVGYGEYDGHLVVGYGSKGNDQADFVVIDVDDDGKPSPDDVLITDDGQTVTLGEIEAEETQFEENPDDDSDDMSDGVMSL